MQPLEQVKVHATRVDEDVALEIRETVLDFKPGLEVIPPLLLGSELMAEGGFERRVEKLTALLWLLATEALPSRPSDSLTKVGQLLIYLVHFVVERIFRKVQSHAHRRSSVLVERQPSVLPVGGPSDDERKGAIPFHGRTLCSVNIAVAPRLLGLEGVCAAYADSHECVRVLKHQ